MEGMLAKKRASISNRLIPLTHRGGRILDIGCGCFPYFLMNTEFAGKFGIDKSIKEHNTGSICHELNLFKFDIEAQNRLPFADDMFDVITMLAVLEHLATDNIAGIIREIRRVLKKDGMFVITTPAIWSGWLLKLLAKLRLVSQEEVEEHKDLYTINKIKHLLKKADFIEEGFDYGYFEVFMNIWFTAKNIEHTGTEIMENEVNQSTLFQNE